MSPDTTAQGPDTRQVSLGGTVLGGTPKRVLALAWMRLAGEVAPPGAELPWRVTVLQPFRLRG